MVSVDGFRVALFLSAAVLVASWVTLRLRRGPMAATRELEKIMLVELALVAAYFAENLSTSVSAKVFWDGIQLAIDGMLGPLYLKFASVYSQREARKTWSATTFLTVPSVVAGLFVATSPWHHLARAGAQLVPGEMLVLTYPFEPVDYLVFTVLYVCLFTAMGLLVVSGLLRHRAFLFQVLFLGTGVFIPSVLGLLAFANVNILGERDLTPFYFAVGTLITTFSALRGRVLRLVPLARDTLVESQLDAIIVVDQDANVIDVNGAARAFLATEKPVGESLAQLWPAFIDLRKVLPEGPVRVEHADAFWEFRAHPLADEGTLLVARDVSALVRSERKLEETNAELERRVERRTQQIEEMMVTLKAEVLERKQAEKTSLQNEKKFRAVFDNATQLMCLLDYRGLVLALNRTALELAERDGSEILGRPFPSWRPLAETSSEREKAEKALARALDGKYTTLELCLSEPERRILDCSLKPVVEDGRVTVIIFEARDITKLRDDEAERAQLHGLLQHSERMEMIGRLAGGVAHDFNNLLTVILAGTEALRENELKAEGREALEEIEQAAENATLVTRQLLAFSRRSASDPRTVDAHLLIEQLSRVLRRLLGEKHSLKLELVAPLSMIHIAPGHLEQCLTNLVVNARDAMPVGGTVTLTTRVDATKAPAHSEGYLAISVRDHGTGMSEPVRQRIFDAFFTTKASGKGTGLGLHTVRKFVEDALGFVEVESREGAGTVFELYLPLSTKAPAEAHAESDPEVVGTETLVLVEDLRPLRELVARDLRKLGYDTQTYSTAEKALEALLGTPQPPDVLVTDVILPGLDGVELCRILRQKWPKLPVIFTTGYAGDSSLENQQVRPRTVVLYKPYRPEQLAASIRQLLANADQP